MEFIKTKVYDAYCYTYSLIFGDQQEIPYECNATEATIKLKTLIPIIFHQIEAKKARVNERLGNIKKSFLETIHNSLYREDQRIEFSRQIANLQQDIAMLTAIQEQVQKLQTVQTQLIAQRKDASVITQFLPLIDNLVFAENTYETSLQIKLTMFTDFLAFLWGKPYVLNSETNFVEPEFKQIVTKIPMQAEYEQTCNQFCQESLIMPQTMYRCNEELSKVYMNPTQC